MLNIFAQPQILIILKSICSRKIELISSETIRGGFCSTKITLSNHAMLYDVVICYGNKKKDRILHLFRIYACIRAQIPNSLNLRINTILL